MSLVIVRALGLCTVQDLGRPGHMHQAVPPGGALVAERLIAANRAVRNPDDAPALEILGQLTVRAERAIDVASDRAPARLLAPGGELAIASEPRRVTYLAVRGGIAAPQVLGGRGTLLCAGLGGLVRTGQRFELAGLAEVAPATHAPRPATAESRERATRPRRTEGPDAGPPDTGPLDDNDALDTPIRVIPGPDADAFAPGALELLVTSAYRVLPSSDRVGTRLDGAALPRTGAPEISRPMVLGAIEVPRDGKPIVLGPEHPTTGGYPVIAVVARADLGRLFSVRLGGTVRFTR